MRSGMMAQGASKLSASAVGRRNRSLFFSEPKAIFRTIESSRAAAKPTTYRGVTAASSITTPAAFAPAFVACPMTSSIERSLSWREQQYRQEVLKDLYSRPMSFGNVYIAGFSRKETDGACELNVPPTGCLVVFLV